MSVFDSILGQARAVDQLHGALRRGTAHHAYLFDGPEGVGKRTLAKALAQALNCERGEGCGSCDACVKIEADIHPDVKWFPVSPEKGQTERVREFLPQLGFPPHEGRRRLVVFDPADELNASASNVLLKTLEEPPAHTHFVLVSARPASLLVTIRSRCQRVSLLPLPQDLIVGVLRARQGVAEDVARQAAALAQGSLGRALALAAGDELPRRQAMLDRWLAAVHAGSAAASLAAAAELAGDRDEAVAVLELLWLALHEAIVAGGRQPEATTPDATTLTWLTSRPIGTLLRDLRAVREAADAIHGNVSPQMAMERLLLDLGQNESA